MLMKLIAFPLIRDFGLVVTGLAHILGYIFDVNKHQISKNCMLLAGSFSPVADTVDARQLDVCIFALSDSELFMLSDCTAHQGGTCMHSYTSKARSLDHLLIIYLSQF